MTPSGDVVRPGLPRPRTPAHLVPRLRRRRPARAPLSIPGTGTAGPPVSYAVTAPTPGPATSTVWSFGDGVTASGAAVSHTFAARAVRRLGHGHRRRRQRAHPDGDDRRRCARRPSSRRPSRPAATPKPELTWREADPEDHPREGLGRVAEGDQAQAHPQHRRQGRPSSSSAPRRSTARRSRPA